MAVVLLHTVPEQLGFRSPQQDNQLLKLASIFLTKEMNMITAAQMQEMVISRLVLQPIT